MVNDLPANAGDMGSIPGSGEDPLKEGIATAVFLPGESHGRRAWWGYSPWGHKELNATEHAHRHAS